MVSLLIGFIAGGLGALTTLPDPCLAGSRCNALDKEARLALVAIGYAGTDIIEGFVRKHLPDDKTVPARKLRTYDVPVEPDDDAATIVGYSPTGRPVG